MIGSIDTSAQCNPHISVAYRLRDCGRVTGEPAMIFRFRDTSLVSRFWISRAKKVSVWPGSEGRYVPSPRETKTWRTLKQFGADWGYWRWSGDSKSILMARIFSEPGEQPGIYPLNIADRKWALIATLNGLSVSSGGIRIYSRLHRIGNINARQRRKVAARSHRRKESRR